MANLNNETQVHIDIGNNKNITKFSLVPAATDWDKRIDALKLDPKHLAPHVTAQWGKAFTKDGQINSPVYSTPALPQAETSKIKSPGRFSVFNKATAAPATDVNKENNAPSNTFKKH